MSKCTVSIELDDAGSAVGGGPRVLSIGKNLEGVVKIEVNAECICNDLIVTKTWNTYGRGNRFTGDEDKISLFSGTWAPGTYEYPFSWKIEDGPLTYRGELLNVGWILRAQADIPWALDPRAEQDFVVQRGDSQRSHAIGELNGEAVEPSRGVLSVLVGGVTAFLWAILCLLAMLLGSMLVWIALEGISSGQVDVLYLALGASLVVIPPALVGRHMRMPLAEHKLGDVEIDVQPNNAKPGERIRCTIRFRPQKDLQLKGVVVTLLAEEVVGSGSPRKYGVHRRITHNDQKVVAKGRHCTWGQPTELVAEFQIPQGAGSSFTVSDNALNWSIRVQVDILDWPSWRRERSIRVG